MIALIGNRQNKMVQIFFKYRVQYNYPSKFSFWIELGDLGGLKGKRMSKNNPVGNISKKRPILNRMKNAVMEIYLDLSEEEMKSLQEEIQSVTETNCDYKIYDIAKMLKGCVDIAVNRI